MPTILSLFAGIRESLEHVHPILPWAILTLGIFLAVYASRKFLPKLWAWFDEVTPDGTIGHVVQGLPSVGLGAVLSVLLTGGDFEAAWKGAVFGALAPVLHLVLKALPVPYQGAVKAIATRAGIALLVLLSLPGCSGTIPPGALQLIDTVANAVHTVATFADAAQKLAPVVADVPDRIARGRRELADHDYITAAGTFFSLAQEFRSAGVPMPDEVQAATDYLGMVAAQSIEQGMRAVSGRNPDGSAKP